MRILVPSAGAASSVSVIREAVRRRHFVLATDLNEHAVGMRLAHVGVVSGMCYEEPYVNNIIEMCHDHNVKWIVPINDVELPIYVRYRQAFEKAGLNLLMNPDDCVLNSHCKEKSWGVCAEAKIRQPLRYFDGPCSCDRLYTQLEAQMPPESCFPIIAKPVKGVGGRDQHICCSPQEVRQLLSRTALGWLSHHIWQQYIHGEEYSVDCWGDPNTDQFVAVPRTRGRIVNGQATCGMTRHDPEVVDFVREICKAFGSTSVCCVQVIREKVSGKLYFIELNPRYGTGVSLSFEAGVDFLDLQWRHRDKQLITEQMLTYEVGVGMARHWQECYYRDEAKNYMCGPV